MKTKKNFLKHRHTIKKNSLIVRTFLEMMNTIKLYNFNTKSFTERKSTDELYEKMNKTTDKLVEVLLGKKSSRVNMVENRIQLIDIHSNQSLRNRIFEYRIFLIDFNMYFSPNIDSDILSIRDETLEYLNQFLYLLTLQ